MTENEPDSDQNVSDPFSSESDPFSSESTEAGPDASASFSSDAGMKTDPALLMNMAKMWVQEHQRASMLGAFALGVFVGSLFRD